MDRDELARKVHELHSLGYSYKRIAEVAGTSKSTVERIINSKSSQDSQWDNGQDESQDVPEKIFESLGTLNKSVPVQLVIKIVTSQISLFKLDYNDYVEDMAEAFTGWQVTIHTLLKFEGRSQRLIQKLKWIAEVLKVDLRRLSHYLLLESIARQLERLIEEASSVQEEHIQIPSLKNLSRECRNSISKDLLDER